MTSKVHSGSEGTLPKINKLTVEENKDQGKPSNTKLSSIFLDSLEVERKEDYEQSVRLLTSLSPKQLVIQGLAIINLTVINIRSSIGSKVIVELGLHSSISSDNNHFDSNDFKIGDIVKLDKYHNSANTVANKKKKLANSSKKSDQEDAELENVELTGVVTTITESQINIALNQDTNTKEGQLENDKLFGLYSTDLKVWLVKISNEITYNRMESTMRKLNEIDLGSLDSNLVRLLLGETKFVQNYKDTDMELQWINDNLNDSQKSAIEFALDNELSIIHGPPGTGKTSTVVELTKQLVKTRADSKSKILICGPSNISIDTILERLIDTNDSKSSRGKIIRIGHPARILSNLLPHSLDYIVENDDSNEVLKGILQDINKTAAKIKKTKNYRDRKTLYLEIKDLKKDLKYRSRKAVSEVLNRADIILATLHGSSSRELVTAFNDSNLQIDTLIIDEVSQSLEPSCWIPIIYYQNTIKKLIIAGDNKQLSPTIKTINNQRVIKTLTSTLFDRLVKIHENHKVFVKFLNIQYRMNEKIMTFPSMELYNGELKAHESVKSKTVRDLLVGDKRSMEVVEGEDDNIDQEIIWYDTQGGDFPESQSDDLINNSKFNQMEAYVVLKHIKDLLALGIKESQIGVIAPYNGQINVLKSLIRVENNINGIEISTVDGFQGREKEIIILSLTRSNSDREVGFLSDFKRLNVSITRSKKQLCVVGDMETIGGCQIAFLKKWCSWCDENVDVRYITDIGEL